MTTTRKMIRFFAVPLLAAATLPAGLVAQTPAAAATLTLEEAITLARRNNPGYLAQRNDEDQADWAVRAAYGALLPSGGADFTMQYRAAGQQRLGVVGFGETPDFMLSEYNLGLNYRLDGASLFRPGQARANRRAVQARVDAAGFTLAADVTRQYLAVLRAEDGVELAKQELARALETLKLAQARADVGVAILLNAKQAAVEKGRAEVALLQAENTLRVEKLRLIERLGVDPGRDIELTSKFPVFEPAWSTEELIARAMRANPQLEAARAEEAAGRSAVRMARTAYLPTVNFSTGLSGFTNEATDAGLLVQDARRGAQAQLENCQSFNDILSRLTPPMAPQDCTRFLFTPADEAAIRRSNEVFPFNFTKQPLVATLSVSLPVFNGFSRELQVETARVAADDAKHARRAEELRLRTTIASAYTTLQTAARTVALEEENRRAADEQLEMARERYRVGVAPFLELQEAETLKARADRAYLEALYAFHETLADLEGAVGQGLRP